MTVVVILHEIGHFNLGLQEQAVGEVNVIHVASLNKENNFHERLYL